MPAVWVPEMGVACNLLPITGHKTVHNCKNLPVLSKDVFICSYPKSGTTWTQNIVYQLLSNGAELDHISAYAPFFCADRSWDQKASVPTLAPGVVEAQERLGRRVFNTHLWWPMLPTEVGTVVGSELQPNGRFIYLVRGGKDVANSFANHLMHQAVSDGGYEGSYAEFIADWAQKRIDFGGWTDHLKSWLCPDVRGIRPIDDPRVLVLTFEEMKRDLRSCVHRIAAHIECGLDEAAVDSLLPKMDFAYMKAHKEKFHPKSVEWRENGDGWEFVNKGTVGAASAAFGPAEDEAFAAMMEKAFPAGAVAELGLEARPDLAAVIAPGQAAAAAPPAEPEPEPGAGAEPEPES
eukprot:SAG22_NODE_344_length_11914_cov_6.665679_8_plen_349_part_00